MSRENAEHLLQHYFRTAWEAAGLQWNSDNDSEVGAIVDNLVAEIDSAVEAHRENEPHIYPDGSTS